MKRAIIVFLLLASALATGQTAMPLSAEEILEKNLEATGGRAAWLRVKTIVKIGTTEGHNLRSRMTPGPAALAEIKGSVRLYETMPDRYMIYQDNDRSGSTYFGCNHDVMWWYLPSGFTEKKPAKPKDCDVTIVPEKWADRYEKMEVKGTKTINGRNAYEVKLTREGQNAILYFDTEAFLLVRSSGVYAFRGGTPTAHQTDYLDYAEVDGLKFAFTLQENFNQGQARTHYGQIYVDARIADSMFDPPKPDKK